MSVSKKAKRRGTILDEIMRYHRQNLPKIIREVPLADVRALASVAPPPFDFYQALKTPGVALIAECKRASPSKGLIAPDYDPVRLAETYVKAGSQAISVLTDARHFQGSLEHLRDVKSSMLTLASVTGRKVPVLRKDFIFDPYQLHEARAAGADAILLIAAVLGASDLNYLLKVTHSLEMDALVEVHTEEELERALALNPRIIGINNRNLQTFAVNFENTARLRDMIPEGVVVVGESGLRTADDVRRMAAIGVDAVLVGEALVRGQEPYETARALVNAGSEA
jgi:indole-3-glycerol phosphate synthase